MHKKYIVYVDLDDTIADFRGSAERLLGRKLNENCRDITVDEWLQIQNDWSFYQNLNLKEGSYDLMHLLCSEFDDIIFLTAIPSKVTYSFVVMQKYHWVIKYFPTIHMIAVESTDSKLIYADPLSILIDDKLDVIEKWRHSGGVGIHYINAEQVIDEIKQLLL